MPTSAPAPTVARTQVHRVEVRPKAGSADPKARAVLAAAQRLGVPVREVLTTRVYLIEAELSRSQVESVCRRLLVDPVTERFDPGVREPVRQAAAIEVHPLPGVMDPVAQSVREAIRDLVGVEAAVSTGMRYDVVGATREQALDLARRGLANPVIHAIHTDPFLPEQLPRGRDYRFTLTHVPIRDLNDEALTKLSREAHLFLSLEEMQAIQAEYRRVGREPTDIELETLAQTWSEHCVHKTLKSKIRYRSQAGGQMDSKTGGDPIRWQGRPGHTVHPDGSVTIDNLLKRTVAAATFELIDEGVDWALSVFKDNAGVIAFDKNHAVCIKVETHNHPSAIEPYGGSATGAGGCIRDVIGTGLAARPIANTDVFCVAPPERTPGSLPPGTLHPRRILQDVVAGVRDYGNRMGIPTLSGAVYFDDRYIGNPLVFCGCIGLMDRDKIKGRVRAGDRVIALGGRTGRDGIHGATFSSAELEGTSADEFSHAVQIGNAIEEKRLMDAILRARDHEDGPLFSAITDCGAGGFSSAIGEMGAELGAEVHLERAPIKYAGLSYTEIWISEAQERMVLSVSPEKLAELKRICDEEHVELADLGEFGTTSAEIVLYFHGQEVGRLSTHLLHEGIPQPTREAVWQGRQPAPMVGSAGKPAQSSVSACLRALLAHPNIASKHWIIRQYDHEVQGNTVIKPLVGPESRGPGDAAVIEPAPGTGRGLAIAQGLQTGVGDPELGGDSYLMTLAAIDECVRNLVCVGADPDRIAILDNFCWPSCGKPENLGTLVRAAEGCYDGAKAYRTPFVSGKDSLNNQLKYTDPATGEQKLIEIPPTLLITGIGIVPELSRCTTMDAKQAGHLLILVGATEATMGGSHYQRIFGVDGIGAGAAHAVPRVDLARGPATARAVARLIQGGLVASAHDVSDGGLLAAIAEMLIAAPSLGAQLDLSKAHADPVVAAFSESPSRYVLEIAPGNLERIGNELGQIPWCTVGTLKDSGRLVWNGAGVDEPVEELARVWLAPLDW